MEALYGVTVALLTIYDMCKVYKKEVKISKILLKEKYK
jgi:molybdenum cofactor biosynthesis enzyme